MLKVDTQQCPGWQSNQWHAHRKSNTSPLHYQAMTNNSDVTRYFVVLGMAADNPECVVDRVVVDVDLGDGLWRAAGDPALVVLIVDHHRRTCRHNRVLSGNNTHHSHHWTQHVKLLTIFLPEKLWQHLVHIRTISICLTGRLLIWSSSIVRPRQINFGHHKILFIYLELSYLGLEV